MGFPLSCPFCGWVCMCHAASALLEASCHTAGHLFLVRRVVVPELFLHDHARALISPPLILQHARGACNKRTDGCKQASSHPTPHAVLPVGSRLTTPRDCAVARKPPSRSCSCSMIWLGLTPTPATLHSELKSARPSPIAGQMRGAYRSI